MATHGNRSATTSAVSNATLATRFLVSVAWIILLVVICGASPSFMQHAVCQGVEGVGDRHLRRFPADVRSEGTISATRSAQSCAVYWPRMYLTVAMLLVLAALSGCAAPPPGTMAPQTAASEVAAHDAVSAEAPLDRTVPLPSGATLKVAADWTVTASA